MKSMVSNSVADTKIALRHFYKDSAGPLEITRRTLTDGSDLNQVRTVVGLGGLISLFQVMIERFNGLFNFNPSKKMTAAQIEDLAAELVLDFLDSKQTPVRLEEMAIFFDRCGRNEFINPKTGRPFIFDRIDKSVVLEIMDFYFEDQKDGRTAAVWSLADEDEKKKRELALSMRTAESSEAAPRPLSDILPGVSSHLMRKKLTEMDAKYNKNEK